MSHIYTYIYIPGIYCQFGDMLPTHLGAKTIGKTSKMDSERLRRKESTTEISNPSSKLT